MINAWENPRYVAQIEYLKAVIAHAMGTSGPILECGSGLSSLILGLVAERQKIQVTTLEHLPQWARKTSEALRAVGVETVELCQAPLKSYGGYDWYDLSSVEKSLSSGFSLVVCDGPPGVTTGGRYGLLPVMGNRFEENCMVLLDDAVREGEKNAMVRWLFEFDYGFKFHGTKKLYAEVKKLRSVTI